MTASMVCHYLFPDDGDAAFEGLIGSLPGSILCEMEERPCEGWILSALAPGAMALFMAIGQPGVLLLPDDTLFVPDAARRACRAAMKQVAVCGADWRRLHGVVFYSKAVRAAFEAFVKRV